MPLPFSEVCTLLSRIEDLELRDPPFLNVGEKSTQIKAVVDSWFKSHRNALNSLAVKDAVAFLSTLLPERRTDRVYYIQATRLCRILSRCLSLSAALTKDLHAYKEAGRGDLGSCVERVLAVGGPPAHPPPGLAEVDGMLDELASQSRFSAKSFTNRLPHSSAKKDGPLGDAFKRLTPIEGKWLVRLILKDLAPLRLDEGLVFRSFHFLLPDLLLFQNDLAAAIGLLQRSLSEYPASCDPRSERLHRQSARAKLTPIVGVKRAGGQKWVLERKYDGEYCEIHIDLKRSPNVSECITIFSKSGKESTSDRSGLHQTITDCLRLGKADCKIKRQAILLGEMVVYSDSERRILPFEKIRKHVPRSGSFIGTDYDSLPKSDEHLAIVFFDILLLDSELVLNKPIDERRMWLREVYTKVAGRAFSSEWKIVDFSDATRSTKVLVNQFAASIAERCEGLILKPCGVPYFALESGANGRLQTFMKLKKDYIAGLGDEADFAVIGASYNAQQAAKCGLPNVQYTDFHLGCLMNKEEVLRFDARPLFRHVGTIQQDFCIPKPVLQAANEIGKFCAKPFNAGRTTESCSFDVDTARLSRPMDVLFDQPFVFEVLGSGFEKPSNCDFFMLRHPRIKKIHQDRSWKECTSFQELQKQASDSRAVTVVSESQEMRNWVERLEKKCRKKFERQRATKTPSTVRTVTTSASQRSTATTVHTAKVVEIDENALDGTTLIATTSPKRKRPSTDVVNTPCPANKRPRSENNPKRSTAARPACEHAAPVSQPLADITNTANQPPRSAQSPAKAPAKTPHPSSSRPNQTKNPSSLLSRLQSLFQTTYPPPPPPNPLCNPATCPLASTAIYLAPCIARTPYIAHDLLGSHDNVIVVPSLECWDRECCPASSRSASSTISSSPPRSGFEQPPEVVRESQAYQGMKRLVVVESKRKQQVPEIVGQLEALQKKGCFGEGEGEGFEVLDWRVLERC
ncbi:uncharacterized protein LTR77_008011 [Saxophila tyrrhenica]|uniref:ATP-dependent DNA ligase family profile domain-containing protein n=1 Tax=Saxophila tyrrhenica TaxID=1690608 RepID=A0AAV9P4X6_9PEZI|nr:hypothetical protein LTR77_008011 [Saxophila tyrrhenica]